MAMEQEAAISEPLSSTPSSITSFIDLDTKRRLSDASQSTTSSAASNTPHSPLTPSATAILGSNISLQQIIGHQQQLILHQQQIAEFYQQQLLRVQQQQQRASSTITGAVGSRADASEKSSISVPRSLPPPPFFLTKQVVQVVCSPLLLERLVCCSLREALIDHEYSPSLHIANCYVYCCSGFSNFLIRSFSTQPSSREGHQLAEGGNSNSSNNNNSESFVIEFQNVRGSNTVFLSNYEKIAETIKHLSIHGSEGEAKRNTSSSSPHKFLGPSDSTPNPEEDDNEIVPDNDMWDQNSVQALGCFASMLGAGDASDEMACSTANSVCALASSRRARKAMGKRAEIGLEAWRNSIYVPHQQFFPNSPQSPPSSSETSSPIIIRSNDNINTGDRSPQTPPLPPSPSPPPGSVPVAQLLWHLLIRACTPCFFVGMPVTSPRASVELVTACAHALAKLSEDKKIARVLGSFHAVPRLMYAVFTTRHSAASASFRREGLKAARWILLNDHEARRTARTIQRCLESARLMPGVNNPQIGDECLDQCTASIIEILHTDEETLNK
jgi:hypothetical protein